jgi:hypothetical protein
MPWVRIDDGFVDHLKIARVGAMGAWLQLQALCYANRNLTDGFIPQDVAEGFVSRGVLYIDEQRRRWMLGQTCGAAGRDIGEAGWPAIMVRAGLWETVRGGYRIHDFDQYQPSRAQVLAARKNSATRMQKTRANRRVEEPGKTEESEMLRPMLQRNRAATSRAPVPVPVPLEEKDPDPDARARAREARTAARAQDPKMPSARHPPAAVAGVRGGDPMRLGDLLAAAMAARERKAIP